MFRALQCPLEEDLSSFTRYLRSQGVVHRVTEEGNQQVVWTRDEAGAHFARECYAEGVPQTPDIRPAVRNRGPSGSAGWMQTARGIPLTLGVLLVTGVVALLTGLGSQVDGVVMFTFVPPENSEYMASQIDLGQWWRLITPIFLHFGLMHLAFNALWYWELGRRIELRSGSLWLLGLTLLFGLVSNSVQWLFSGQPFFGGLSGVLYGLLGYCWIYQLMAPNVHFALPKGVVVLMLVWLVLCLSGLVTLLGFGAIANAAHVSGLLVGCAAGLVAGGSQRFGLSR
ncbi:rhomboid family intramembrane serine protease [Halopseudomonas salina]|uniref:Rhomboid family intramembrane serine protease n=1 Tax=Halopseudomonas salina TaxID=1323744 RepID=A0ABQ1Q1K2_9GAMM|nr:rhomboid family intramembrane serine protease [Halopseudomonas salina]GGD09604.1 rhomboid family intramembrane serine protease [Halopseudomonas salina]